MVAGTSEGLSYERVGVGEPLVLVHGTGSSRAAWRPILPLLSGHHELILVDLPGHGDSEVSEAIPNPAGYAPLIGELLDSLRLKTAHAAGFSVGGWTALELAKLGRARSVVGLAPAGLWSPRSPKASEFSLWLTQRVVRIAAPLLPVALRTGVGRTVFMGQMYGRPWRVPAAVAIEEARGLATTRGFDEHLAAVNHGRFVGGRGIDVPVTIAFGSRERLLSRRARRREQLPPQARWVDLPGCGHVPFWDDPRLVADTILDTTRRASELR